MNILLLGKNGLLGQALYAVFPDASYSTRQQLDLTDLNALHHFLCQSAPSVIINAAAYTAVDLAETEPEPCYRINHEAVQVLADYATTHRALLVHFSTDYVFDGLAQTPYTETHPCSPLNRYGHSKLLGEHAILDSGCAHLIFRLGWLYGIKGQHFVSRIAALAQQQKQLAVVTDQTGTPTPVEWVAHVVLQALQAYQQQRLPKGVYHLSPNGSCTWFDLAHAILTQLRQTAHLKGQPIATLHSTTQLLSPRAAQRPTYSVLSNQRLFQALHDEAPDWYTLFMPTLRTLLKTTP